MAKSKLPEWSKPVFERRASNTSNAFIFPTMDKVRWDEIRRVAWYFEFKDGRPFYEWNVLDNRVLRYSPVFDDEGNLKEVEVKELFFTTDIVDDLQIVSLKELPIENVVSYSSESVPMQVKWKVLSAMMRQEKTTMIVNAVGLSERNEVLSFFVGSVAKDSSVFANRSSLFLIIPSQEYVNNNVRKLSVVVEPPLSTPEERRELMLKQLKAMKKLQLRDAQSDTEKKKIEAKFKKLVKQVNGEIINASAGLTLDEVESAMLLSLHRYGDIRVDAFKEYKIEFLKKMGIEYIEPEYGFEAVGGYGDLKEYIRDIIFVIRHPEEVKDYGDSVPRGLLLYGLPGTGKTWFAHALAKELNLPVVKISPADFLRGVVGETEARIKQLTRVLDSISPAVVFIDEIDQIAMARDKVMSTDSGVSRRMTNMLLQWLGDENRKAFVVGATNFLDQMDSAFIRPGRIDEIVFVPLPDLEARKEILEIHMKRIKGINTKKIKIDDGVLWEVAKRTDGWIGSDLRLLCEKVKRYARKEKAKEITLNHFIRAMEGMGVNPESRKKQVMSMLVAMEKIAKDGNIDMDYINKIKRQMGLGGKKRDENSRLKTEKKKTINLGGDLGIGF